MREIKLDGEKQIELARERDRKSQKDTEREGGDRERQRESARKR